MNLTKSHSLFEKAKKVIPGGVHSPVRSFKHVGMNPIYFERAEGPYLYDVDGNRYLDFCLSFGPHLLGHSHPQIVKAIQEQAVKATSFGACHPLEVSLSEKVLEFYPFLDKVRLVNSGTEAVMTAVRAARGATGRSKIIVFDGCYHGHSDGLLAKAGSGVAELSEASSQGIPPSVVKETLIARLDDLATVSSFFKKYPQEIAAILMEPIPANNGLYLTPQSDIDLIEKMAKDQGTLLIFDECISGFRVSAQGACGYYQKAPDLVTMGKIVGGGLPLAAVAGKKSVMDQLAPEGSVYQAGTLSGNPLAVGAGLAALTEIQAQNPYPEIEKNTQEFVSSLQALVSRFYPLAVRQVGSLFWLEFGQGSQSFPPKIEQEEKRLYTDFFKKALAAGIYFAPSPYEVSFVSSTHSKTVLSEALERLKKCLEK